MKIGDKLKLSLDGVLEVDEWYGGREYAKAMYDLGLTYTVIEKRKDALSGYELRILPECSINEFKGYLENIYSSEIRDDGTDAETGDYICDFIDDFYCNGKFVVYSGEYNLIKKRKSIKYNFKNFTKGLKNAPNRNRL